jgi:hypothetical protein
MWNGFSIGRSIIHVDLPKIESDDEVFFVFPSTARDASPYYIPTTDDILNGRDLSLYENGGYVESCGFIDEWENCLKQRAKARRFVFEHWTQKKLGYIQIGLPCADCGPVDHIFVEPDPNGNWRVVVTLATNGPVRTQVARKLKFRSASEDEERRSNSATILVFIDHHGKEVEYF